MYRYFALIWNPRDAQAETDARRISERLLSAPTDWSGVYETEGVAAFHAGLGVGASETLLLHSDAGAVFGRIFNNGIVGTAATLRVAFAYSESLKIVQTGARRLIEHYWGRYVALVHDSDRRETWVLRDPMGQLPCLLADWQGVHLVFSDMEDCVALGLLRFSVNWHYIRALLTQPGLQNRATAIQEVSEIQPGERVCFAADHVHRSLEWRPFNIAQTEPITATAAAIAALRRSTRGCVHAWAACYSSIVHTLSGGLDSSIVLSCLTDAPGDPQIACLNYFGTAPGEDERKFARRMATHARVQLIERELDIHDAHLERLRQLRKSARPWDYLYELQHGRFESQLATARQAQSLFSGAGGDGIFCQARADLAVTDYLFDRGFGRDLLRVAVDAANVSRQSVWPLLLRAARSYLFRRNLNSGVAPERPARTLVSRDVLRDRSGEESLAHPWFTPAAIRGVAPGVLWHVMTIASPPAYYDSFSRGPHPERTLPLLSQPLVELCLRIPTYVLIRSGVDRAAARQAFAADLPPEILKRRNKGRIDQHLRDLLDANLEWVRDFLLDGRLVRQGLLDRSVLDLYLTRATSPADFQCSEILQQHLCIEAWLSSWLDDHETVRAAAPSDRSQTLRI